MSTSTTIFDLNQDITRVLFSSFEPDALCAIAPVCKKWKQISEDQLLWKTLLVKNFPGCVLKNGPSAPSSKVQYQTLYKEQREFVNSFPQEFIDALGGKFAFTKLPRLTVQPPLSFNYSKLNCPITVGHGSENVLGLEEKYNIIGFCLSDRSDPITSRKIEKVFLQSFTSTITGKVEWDVQSEHNYFYLVACKLFGEGFTGMDMKACAEAITKLKQGKHPEFELAIKG